MKTIVNITPLSPVLPSESRVRNTPSKKRREPPPAPRDRRQQDEPPTPDDDLPHIDEYA